MLVLNSCARITLWLSGVVSNVTNGLLDDPVSGLLGLAFDNIASSGATPIWQSLVETSGTLDAPVMAFQLTRFVNDSGVRAVEFGGTFTIGATNTSLYIGDIEYEDVPSGAVGYWSIPLRCTCWNLFGRPAIKLTQAQLSPSRARPSMIPRMPPPLLLSTLELLLLAAPVSSFKKCFLQYPAASQELGNTKVTTPIVRFPSSMMFRIIFSLFFSVLYRGAGIPHLRLWYTLVAYLTFRFQTDST